jgi:hypothetical protein
VPRVTADTVKEIIATTISDDIINSNHIDTANVFIAEHFVGTTLSDAILTKIELYLAAHYVALTDEGSGLTRDKLGDADQSYANIYSKGLNSTRFGQAALALDSSGVLANVAAGNLRADFRVV